MSTETPAVQVWRGETWAALALLAGLLCVALSVAWPAISNGQSSWSDEKAVAYQEASAKVHELSMQAGSTAPEEQSHAMHEQLADAQRGQLDAQAEPAGARIDHERQSAFRVRRIAGADRQPPAVG